MTYPAGITLAPCTLLAHMRAESFSEPEAFRPERGLFLAPSDRATFTPMSLGGSRG